MFAVAEMGEFFVKVIGQESLIEIEDDLLSVPINSDQGVHALQGMLANSISHENSTRHDPTDINLGLRAVDSPSLRMVDLFREENLTSNLSIKDDSAREAATKVADTKLDVSYRPMPFLDQGMLSFYMHVDDNEQSVSGFPMAELIQEDELAPVPNTAVLH
ncbi:MAG: hypothetical protein V7776_18825 [Halopseudomonas aestusnigri]